MKSLISRLGRGGADRKAKPNRPTGPKPPLLRRLVRSVFGRGRGIGLLLLAAMMTIGVWEPVPLQFLRIKTFDIYNQIKPREVTERPAMIVDIDERSLSEIGQWPWPRTTLARLVDRLTQMGAVVIGFDIVFSEPDRMSPGAIAGELPGLDDAARQALEGLPDNDSVLAQMISRSRVVLGQSLRSEAMPVTGRENVPQHSIGERGGDPRPWLEQHTGIVRNLEVLEEVAAGRGIFNSAMELDGISRRLPMMANVNGTIEPALSVEMLRVATGNRSTVIRMFPSGGVEGVLVGKSLLKTDERGRVWVYFSRHDPAKYISAVDILRGTVDPAKVAGRLILVGTSAVGLLDIRSTPLDSVIPGVEVHAQILENVLGGTQLQRPQGARLIEMLGALAAGLLMVVLVPLAGARLTVIILALAIGVMAAGSWWFFDTQKMLIDPVYPALCSLLLYMMLTYSNYAREEAERRQVRDAFSRYMSPALVERLAQDPSQLKLGGEMRDMTLLFCDVRGFTTISEQFDAQGLTRLINRFLTPMTNVILDRRGTIDKYMGDCIMAFWNAPLDDDDHAANACRSALAMMDTMVKVNVDLEKESIEEGRKHIPLKVGIGLNSGQVCVGNMGSDQRFDYSVLGDSVNLASRLEGQSKPYGVSIVIGENTYQRAPDFAVLELDLIKVKGKTLPVRIFTLLGDEAFAKTPDFIALRQVHDLMIAAYRAQDWDRAEDLLQECRRLSDGLHIDGFYDLYADRLADYRVNSPGADWDGVYVATSK